MGLTYEAIYTICACIDATICRVSSRAVLVVERAEARRVRRVNFVGGLTWPPDAGPVTRPDFFLDSFLPVNGSMIVFFISLQTWYPRHVLICTFYIPWIWEWVRPRWLCDDVAHLDRDLGSTPAGADLASLCTQIAESTMSRALHSTKLSFTPTPPRHSRTLLF